MNKEEYMRTRHLTAVHEGGHCVAAWYVGARVHEVCLLDYDRGTCSRSHAGLNYLAHHNIDKEEVRDGVLIVLAGIGAMTRKALELGTLHAVWDTESAQSDLTYCMSRLYLIDPTCGLLNLTFDQFYMQYGQPARTFPYWPGLWPTIEAVANALLQKRRLSGQEAVAVILDNWQGTLPPKARPIEEHGTNSKEKEDSENDKETSISTSGT